MCDKEWRSVWSGKMPPVFNLDTVIEDMLKMSGFDAGIGNIDVHEFLNGQQALRQTLLMTPDTSIFDVGCGSGTSLYTHFLAGSPVGGIDIAPALIEYACKAMPGGDFAIGEAMEMDTCKKYDIVCAFGVFLYFSDAEYAQAVARKMFKKAKRMVLITGVLDENRKDEAIAFRKSVWGEDEYHRRYDGLDHLYLQPSFLEGIGQEYGYECCITHGGAKSYYGDSQIKFHCRFERHEGERKD